MTGPMQTAQCSPPPTRRSLLIAAGAAALTAAAGSAAALRAGRRHRLYRWRGTALGADSTMLLDAGSPERGAALAELCLAEIGRLEDIFSLFRPDSAISRLNRDGRLAGPPPEMVALLALCRRIWKTSDGAFDPTVQPLWRALAENVPPDRLEAARTAIGMDKLRVTPQEVAFAAPGMAITLNGIAQGYISDRVAALLRREGLNHTLVQLGESRALGPRPDGTPWLVRIAGPERPERARAAVTLDSAALAVSSGEAMRFAAGGTHILDPATGKSPSHLRTVAVRAPRADVADGLSTALSVLPPEAAPAFLRRYPGTAGYDLGEDGSLRQI